MAGRAVIILMPISCLILCFYPPTVAGVGWPNGLYTLPRADTQTACPEYSDDKTWDEGFRYQDTETIGLLGGNEWSSPNHLLGPHSKHFMQWNFCSKTRTDEDPTPAVEWGPGKYCIMKKGTQCPTGFIDGWVQWDDDDSLNSNDFGGILPEGVYDKDTLIYFCCREDGSTVAPLNLPTSQPFILFMKEAGTCQNVNGMIDTMEWFRWDGEDELLGFDRYFGGSVPYHDGRDNNHKVHFCYYIPA